MLGQANYLFDLNQLANELLQFFLGMQSGSDFHDRTMAVNKKCRGDGHHLIGVGHLSVRIQQNREFELEMLGE